MVRSENWGRNININILLSSIILYKEKYLNNDI